MSGPSAIQRRTRTPRRGGTVRGGSVRLASPPSRAASLAPKAEVPQDSLNHYLSQLQRYPLLSARQERELAREIAELEVDRWRAVLSYRAALQTVSDTLTAELPAAARTLKTMRRVSHLPRHDARRRSTFDTAAQTLSELDQQGAVLEAVESRVESDFARDGRARSYHNRMRTARRRQQRAKEKFVNANLRLVVSTAQRFRHGEMSLADLIQEGNIGLLRAVDRFDHTRGYRFSTYATWWIRHYITRAIADKSRLIRIPVHTLDAITRVARAENTASGRAAGIPDDAALAELTEIPEAKVAQLRQHKLLQGAIRLDRPFGEDQDQTMHDMLAAPQELEPETSVDRARLQEEVRRLVETLPPKQAEILRCRFGLEGEELTLRELGDKYDLSRERIRQLQEQALSSLRDALAGADFA